MVFEVSGIEEATLAVNPNNFGWFLTLKPTYLREDKINVSKELAFDLTTNSIVDIETYNRRLILFLLADKANRVLRKHYNPTINGWIDEHNTYNSSFGSIIAYSRPIIQKYFVDITLLYFSTIDSNFMTKWNTFLSTKNPEDLGLSNQTQFNPELIEIEDYTSLTEDNFSVLDSFIVLFRMKHWLEDEYNE